MIITFPGHLKAEEREKDPKQHGEEQSEEERGMWIEILGCCCGQKQSLVKSLHDKTIQFLLTRTFGFSSF